MSRIVIASDSFKGSLSSEEVARAAAKAVRARFPSCEVAELSVADGGEGTSVALTQSLGGSFVSCSVHDPLGRPTGASYGIAGDTAIIEMAAASGLPLLSKEERNPLVTSTFGTGEMIADALFRGCRRFLVGIGGSATNDGGTGMLAALGVRFLDTDGAAIEPCGGSLAYIARIDLSAMLPALREASFTVACDVDTPFCGPEGASAVFAPQKGATEAQVAELEAGMASFAALVRSSLGVDIADMPGAGAAGGLGGAFHAFLGAMLCSGIDMVLDAAGFDSLLAGASLVITGEGKADSQTPKGKTATGILRRAKAAGVPALLIAGKVGSSPELLGMGFKDILQVTPEGMPLEEAMQPEVASDNIYNTLYSYFE